MTETLSVRRRRTQGTTAATPTTCAAPHPASCSPTSTAPAPETRGHRRRARRGNVRDDALGRDWPSGSGWCERAAAAIDAHADALAAELAEEQGKPLHEAAGEVAAGCARLPTGGRGGTRPHGYSPPVEDTAKRVVVMRQPRGVWAVLTPWNFPFNIPIEYLGPAVATGSPVVWKPAPTCARIASRLVGLLNQAGVPPGLVNLVLTDDVAVAQGLVTHRGVDAVGLTGGTRTGEAVARAAWDKHLLLELGGNGPVIVLDDADMERASAAVASAAFTNAGQVCSAAGRVLVADTVADELAEALMRSAGAVVLGAPDGAGVTMGPVHTEAVAATMDRHIADALEHGATVRAGGRRAAGHPTALYYEPTVHRRRAGDRQVAVEETFGPIAPADPLAMRRRAAAGGERERARPGGSGLHPARCGVRGISPSASRAARW